MPLRRNQVDPDDFLRFPTNRDWIGILDERHTTGSVVASEAHYIRRISVTVLLYDSFLMLCDARIWKSPPVRAGFSRNAKGGGV